MTDLLTRLTAAQQGSRELDAAICCWKNGYELTEVSPSGAFSYIGTGGTHLIAPTGAPEYTTSLDAALTLVPEGWWLHSLEGCQKADEWWVQIELIKPPYTHIDTGEDLVGKPTAALAVCLVAIRAREASEKSSS